MLKKVIPAIILACGISGLSAPQAFAKDYSVTTMKAFKSGVQSNLQSYEPSFKMNYKGNITDFKKEIKTIIPTLLAEDDLVAGTLKSYKYSYSTSGNTAEVRYTNSYFPTKAQAFYTDEEIRKIATTIEKTYKTNFDRVKAVNDYIVLNTNYGGDVATRHTVYGVLKMNEAVCQGYAMTTYELLKQLNIPVRYVTGTSKNQNHAWNKVQIDKKWYNLDVTWNDPTPNRPNIVSYRYFLLSDKAIAKDHAWKKENYPTASTTTYDFLNRSSSMTMSSATMYYANSNDRERLYTYNVKTKKHKKISNTRVQFLNYYKGKLYFSNYSNGARVASMTNTGKSLKNHNKVQSKNLYIQGKYLYYEASNKKQKIKL